MKNDWTLIIIVICLLVIGSLGGLNLSGTGGGPSKNATTTPLTPEQQRLEIQKEIREVEKEVSELQKKIQAEQDAKLYSKYKDTVSISSVNRTSDVSREQIRLFVNRNAKEPINITGWTLTSTSSGARVKIPKATYLFFADSQNSESDVYVKSGETIYITTGYSPNGYSFKLNKCSGYLSQFQNWNPNLPYNCPLPRNEDLSSIPKLLINDACFDYIDRFPQCRIETKTLPLNWSYECKNFIYSKINYPSCVNTHKDDSDFYVNQWRIYLKRSERLWKNSRETIVLYDNEGKIVDTYRY